MNVYVCTDHEGFWPVGVASVVIAGTKHEARILLMEELLKRGLSVEKPFTLQLLDTTLPRAVVLHDGDY